MGAIWSALVEDTRGAREARGGGVGTGVVIWSMACGGVKMPDFLKGSRVCDILLAALAVTIHRVRGHQHCAGWLRQPDAPASPADLQTLTPNP
jgi:hypothetical protein